MAAARAIHGEGVGHRELLVGLDRCARLRSPGAGPHPCGWTGSEMIGGGTASRNGVEDQPRAGACAAAELDEVGDGGAREQICADKYHVGDPLGPQPDRRLVRDVAVPRPSAACRVLAEREQDIPREVPVARLWRDWMADQHAALDVVQAQQSGHRRRLDVGVQHRVGGRWEGHSGWPRTVAATARVSGSPEVSSWTADAVNADQ